MRIKNSNHPTDLALWLGIFFYVLGTGLLIQLVILPHIFPAWHAGDGLLKGLDTTLFNTSTIELLDKIKTTGWQNWSLKYNGQTVVGIAALFYTLISPHPWSMLPLNGILNATAGLAIFHIILYFIKDRRKAFFATLPFIIFPTALSWTAQYHNDNYMVTGVALFLLGWINLSLLEQNATWKRNILAVFEILIGCILIWLVRVYALEILIVLAFIIACILTIILLIKKYTKILNWKKFIISILFIWLSIGVNLLVVNVKFVNFGKGLGFGRHGNWSSNPINPEKTQIRNYYERRKTPWEETSWLPSQIDEQIWDLIRTRFAAYKSHSGSNIDEFVEFTNAVDVIKYLPRAIEIGFLSPFPYQWFETGTKSPNTALRRVTGLEMVFIYISWIGLIFSIWHWRKQLPLWILLFICAGMITIYSIGVINAGSLHRFTFSFTMPLVGLGVAGWFEMIRIYFPMFSKNTQAKVDLH